MISTQSALFIASAFLVVYSACASIQWAYHYRQHVRRHKCAEPTRDPNKLPGGLEHVYNFLTFKGTNIMDEMFDSRVKRLGLTYMQVVCGARTVFTSDPQNCEAIMNFGGQEFFDMGWPRRAAFKPMVHDGILSMNGPRWRPLRGFMKQFFTKSRIDNFENVEKHLQVLFETMPTDSEGYTSDIELLPRLFHFAMDSSSEYLYGRSVNSQLVDVPNAKLETMNLEARKLREVDNKFVDAFELVSLYIFQRVLLQEMYFLADGFSFRKSLKVMHQWIDNFVREALELKKERAKDVESSEGQEKKHDLFVAKLADFTDNPQELRDGALDLLLAGRNTTAATLCWIFFFLSRSPAAYKKLRDEVINEFGYSDPTERATLQRLRSIKYLQWVLSESARLRPAVPINTRKCIKDTVIPRGGGKDGSQPMAVMKGDQIIFNWYSMSRLEEIWGADANEFKPERWEKKESVGWEYTPFGRGPRQCIGQDFSSASMAYLLVRTCQMYDRIECLGEQDDPSVNLRLVMMPAKGVNVRFHRVES